MEPFNGYPMQSVKVQMDKPVICEYYVSQQDDPCSKSNQLFHIQGPIVDRYLCKRHLMWSLKYSLGNPINHGTYTITTVL